MAASCHCVTIWRRYDLARDGSRIGGDFEVARAGERPRVEETLEGDSPGTGASSTPPGLPIG
jgi:hypothetical protein